MTDTAPTAVLSQTERDMLRYALDLCQDQMLSVGDEFTEDDHSAIDSLRRMTVAQPLPSPEDTEAADESPHIYLTSIRHQAGLAHDFTKAGRMAEALEHVEAVERLLAVYRRAVGA